MSQDSTVPELFLRIRSGRVGELLCLDNRRESIVFQSGKRRPEDQGRSIGMYNPTIFGEFFMRQYFQKMSKETGTHAVLSCCGASVAKGAVIIASTGRPDLVRWLVAFQ